MTFCVHSSSHCLIFMHIRKPQMDIQYTQEFSGYSVVYTRVQNAFLCISSDFVCVHKSTYWNVVNARVHTQFYCVSCGGTDNLIWIFSLHFDIRLKMNTLYNVCSTVGVLRTVEGYHEYCGGYLEYDGRCSVPWGILS